MWSFFIILNVSTLSAVKSNIFFKCFKVKSNSKKSQVQQPWYLTFFKSQVQQPWYFTLKKKLKYNTYWTSLFLLHLRYLNMCKNWIDRRHWGHDIEDRRLWGQTTLRIGDFEDKIILKISTISKFAKLLKFSKIVKNIGYMMPTLGGWMFLLDICSNIWRKYVILRVSVWGMTIFYWIYAANIWE